MKIESHQSVERPCMSRFRSSEGGFSTLELLVIVVIVCAVAAIGIPSLHSQAKAAVLRTNLQSLGSVVNTLATEGYSPEYRASGEGDPGTYLSTQLEQSLNTAGKRGYTNPVIGSRAGRVVLNTSTFPVSPQSVPPAVLITASPQYQYASFDALQDGSRRLLAGALVVAFDAGRRTVDVFYVTPDGKKSVDVVDVPTG